MGEISIGDRVVNNVDPKDRDIAMVFQNYALYPSKTVAENMGFALKMQGVPKEERARRVREARVYSEIVPATMPAGQVDLYHVPDLEQFKNPPPHERQRRPADLRRDRRRRRGVLALRPRPGDPGPRLGRPPV